MIIKKYTIDEEIPEGSKFIESKIEKVKVGREYLSSLDRHIDKTESVTYFYFLVEEKERGCACKGAMKGLYHAEHFCAKEIPIGLKKINL